jgi:membrane protein implicated in regulation of membrane protease activity
MGEIPDATPSWMLWSAFGVIAVGAALFLLVLFWAAEGHPALQAVMALGLTVAVPWLIERSRRVLKGTEAAGRHAAITETRYGPFIIRHEAGAVIRQLSIEDTYGDNLRLAI